MQINNSQITYNSRGEPLPWETNLVEDEKILNHKCLLDNCTTPRTDESMFCCEQHREDYWRNNNPTYGQAKRTPSLKEMQAKLKLWAFQAKEKALEFEKQIDQAKQIFGVSQSRLV